MPVPHIRTELMAEKRRWSEIFQNVLCLECGWTSHLVEDENYEGDIEFDMSGCTLGINMENKIYGFGNDSLNEDPPTILGCYETEKRAIAVLDEICLAYISLNSFKGNAPYVKNGVFQMPEV